MAPPKIENRNRVVRYFLPHLVLVQFTTFKLLLAFTLKRDDHKTNEDVDHEESDDDDINDIVDSDPRPVVLKRPFVYISGIDRIL